MNSTPRSDTAIADDIRDTLTWDSRINPEGIQVTVHDGIAFLSGSVRLLAERSIASADAWRVKGVQQVIDQLAVSPTADRTDAEIATDLLNTLTHDRRIDLNHLVVQVAGGVVTLAGAVTHPLERQAAEEAAWYTPGVVAVVNQLSVNPARARPDDAIHQDVRAALDRDARIQDATRIALSVQDGVVTLLGVVGELPERHAAEEDARFTGGVRRVINQLIRAAT